MSQTNSHDIAFVDKWMDLGRILPRESFSSWELVDRTLYYALGVPWLCEATSLAKKVSN